MSDSQIIAWLIGCVLAIVLIVAQLKLFSFDRTLKAILAELRGEKPARPQPRPEVTERLRHKARVRDEAEADAITKSEITTPSGAVRCKQAPSSRCGELATTGH